MFFNKRKNECRTFVFTDKDIRSGNFDSKECGTYSDKLCKGLRLSVSEYGNHSYMYQTTHQGKCISKVIGNIFGVTIKEARDIVNNIRENKAEFIEELPNIKLSLSAYFSKYGKFPHKVAGTETILSDENSSLKQKIKDLEKEIDGLRDMNVKLVARLDTVRRIVNLDENDLGMVD